MSVTNYGERLSVGLEALKRQLSEIADFRDPKAARAAGEVIRTLEEPLGRDVSVEYLEDYTGSIDLEKLHDSVTAFRLYMKVAKYQVLESLIPAAADATEYAKAYISTLLENGEDLRRSVSDYLVSQLGDNIPWPSLMPKSKGFAILYNFAPFQDTGSTVASKRLRDRAQSVDVISCSFLHHKKIDPTIERIASPYVKSKYFLPLTPSWASWRPFAAFAVRAAAIAERYISAANGEYDFFYTRAMWAPSHYAGALVKLKHPELRWTAEFSDPLSLDVEGLPRGGAITEDEVSSKLLFALESRIGPVNDQVKTVFAFAEHLAYAFADEIVFTNANQMEIMLEHVESPDLKARIRDHALVSHHPSLPRAFYEMRRQHIKVDKSKLNLAYFGEFYSSRGLTEVTDAIRSLPKRLRNCVNLYVFTNYIPPSSGGARPRNFSKKQFELLVARAQDGVGANGIEDLVHFHSSLPFLDFLAATDSFDYLLVADTKSGEHHSLNPYLPSKWSDYSGSKAATWAIVEKGSVLSGMSPEALSSVGHTKEAREVLWDLVEKKLAKSSLGSSGGGE